MKKNLLLSLLLCGFLVAGCFPLEAKSTLVFKPRLTRGDSVECDNAVGFEALKNRILIPQCIGCHKGFADEKKFLKEVEPGNAEESTVFQVVKDGSMPKGRPALSTADLEFLRSYIEGLKAL